MALQPYTVTTFKQPKNTIQDLISQYQTAETEAREKQIGQTEKAREYLQQILDIYGAEGAYGKGMEMVLESQKRQDVGKAAQRGISSGLYGIRDYGGEWESNVGAKARATLEDVRLGRRAQALSGLAGFEAGVEYAPPDYSALMQAVSAGQQIPSEGMSYGGGYGGGSTSAQTLTSLPGRTAPPTSYPTAVQGTAQLQKLPYQPKMDKPIYGQKPSIPEYLQQHGIDPNLTPQDVSPEEWKKIEAKSKSLQQQWASQYM